MDTKRCSKCREVKSISEFGKDRGSKDELHSRCKECDKEYRIRNSHRIISG